MKKSTIYIIFILPFFIVFKLQAQDLQNLNALLFEKENFNTAYIASDSNELNVSTIVSIANVVEKNNKFHFLLNGNIGKLGLGFGVKVNTSFHSIFQTTSAEIFLAKRLNLGKKHALSFGLNTGLILNSLRQDKVNQYTNLEDPVIKDLFYDRVGFSAGLGLKYNWNDKFNFGVSLPFLVNTFEGIDPVYIINTSYRQYFGKNFSLTPELVVYGTRYVKPTLEVNTKLNYQNIAYIKVGARLTEQVFFGAGGNIKFIDFAYIYKLSFGNHFKQIFPNVHNVSVKFRFLENSLKKKKS
ncbi:MAG: type IX secretion system membrane protein PorP/SprF [Chitinophagales bacterium]